jgi:chromosome partitioning protein
LGASLALLGKKVLLVDIDPQGNLTFGYGLDPSVTAEKNIYFALLGDSKLKDNIVQTKIPNVFVVPADRNLSGAEVELVQVPDREFRLKMSLTEDLSYFDYVLIDCPPALGLLSLNALAASDSYIVPMQCEFFSLQGLSELIQTVEKVRTYFNPTLVEDGILLTMVDSRSRLTGEVSKEIRSFGKERVFNSIVPRRVRLAESSSHGIPGIHYDASCFGAKSYLEAAKELVDRSSGKFDKIEKSLSFVPPDPVDRFGTRKDQIG